MAAPIAAFNTQNATPVVSIVPSPEYLDQLTALSHSVPTLQKAGYVMYPLSRKEINDKKRCIRCGRRCKSRDKKRKERKEQEDGAPAAEDKNQQKAVPTTQGRLAAKQNPAAHRCRFHPGQNVNGRWTCCRRSASGFAPCASEEFHQTQEYGPGEFESRWKFHSTPFDSNVSPITRAAIAIDCEMGIAVDHESELIRLTAIDYFTGTVLLDSLVWPDIQMIHYNTRYSGVTRGNMEQARRDERCLMGIDAARTELLKYVGPSTIVVGHSAYNDLVSLRWIHTAVVDSFLLGQKEKYDQQILDQQARKAIQRVPTMANAVVSPYDVTPTQAGKKPEDGLSLKAMAMRKLGRAIQTGGRRGHDSLEDAIASRDLVHAHILGLTTEKR
ncbi:hypothetical protein B0H63DRAFT_432374 [Podospora didyma]|uniref:Exonuclease domain-containing protein n=1 Tax=Podospora didyma TaxID=330526 RepID=A0AAE0TZ65_9PEZI|nr:hypothetical protein B0H63DRAFT_432374 [Podospora didyma]